MPQGYITSVDIDTKRATVREGDGSVYTFRHWALGPESAGNMPRVGAFVQYRRQDGALMDVRVITAPPTPAPKYATQTAQQPGIKRLGTTEESGLTKTPPPLD